MNLTNTQINRIFKVKHKYQFLTKDHKPVIVTINSTEGKILKEIGFKSYAYDNEFEILIK